MSRFCISGILLSVIFGLALSTSAQSTQPTRFKFSLTDEKISGFTNVGDGDLYSDATGYGYESKRSATQPSYFSVKMPEGNYRITLKIGDAKSSATTTVKTELRRLALERIHTEPGQFVTKMITANVRQAILPDGKSVSLKPRERQKTPGGEWFEWDDKLTMEFSDEHPAVASVEIEKADELPTVYLCGDSTMCDQPAEPFNSWGQMFPRWFKPDVVIANEAESGETLKDFYAARRVNKIAQTIKKGDYIFVAFGHNDMKPPSKEPVDMYKDFYAKLVKLARDNGATAVIMTPVSRKNFGPDGKTKNSFGDYPDQVHALAKEQNVAFIDLQAQAATIYDTIGPANIQPFFANKTEGTHHSDWGSYNIAKIVVQGVIDNKLPLANSIVDDWNTFDPSHPVMLGDFKLPADPSVRGVATPLGN